MDIFSTKTWPDGVFGSYPYPLIIIINFGSLKSSILFTTSPLFNVKPQYRIIGYFGKYKIRKERGLVYLGGWRRRHLSLTQPICQLVENGIFEYFQCLSDDALPIKIKIRSIRSSCESYKMTNQRMSLKFYYLFKPSEFFSKKWFTIV